MHIGDRILHLVERMGDADRNDYRSGLPGKDISGLMHRLDGRMVRWGSWGDKTLGYDGKPKPAAEAKRTFGTATQEIDSWSKRSKYHRMGLPGGLYWVREAGDPVIKLTLQDDAGMKYVRVELLMHDTREATRIMGKVSEKRDKIFATWDKDSYKLMSWLKKLKMRHNVVRLSGLKDKADRFTADMADAQLQQILGVVGRFAAKQGGLRDKVKQHRSEHEFVQSAYRTWESKNREVGITVRADEYTPENKDSRGGRGFYVTVALWPAEQHME